MFGFSSGEVFVVDNCAQRVLVISTVAAAFGPFDDIWFMPPSSRSLRS